MKNVSGGIPLQIKSVTAGVSLGSILLLAPPSASFAQESALQSQGALEEVMVTARKREENLQDTPISIQAFTAAGLELRNITDISQIGEYTPNMIFDRAAAIGGSNSSAIVYIRGIGQDAGIPTIDLGVGTYVDGVYLARSVGGVFDLIDVERVEVLRGPQGTLFGRNTIGGAISVTTQKPTPEFYSDVKLNLGTDDLIVAQASLNGTITENLFGKASILSRGQDGYVKRPDGTDMGDDDVTAGRVALRWEASDSLLIDLSADATNSDSHGAPWTLVGVDPNAPFPQFHNAFLVPPTEGCFVPPPVGTGSTDSTNPACYNQQWIPNSDSKDYGGMKPKDELDLYGFAGTINWDVSTNISLKSITSYRDTESDFNIDQDHSPHSVAEVASHSTQDQFTQELQLLGTAYEGALNYIVGLYYFEESGEYLETINFSPVYFRSGGSIDNDSAAAYAQATYDFNEKISLTLGVRYTDDTKRFKPDQEVLANNNDKVPPFLVGTGPGMVPPMPPPGTPILPNREEQIDTQETSPLASLSYHWTENMMTYLSYSEGFKGGGFTQRVFPPQDTIPSFKPEYVNVYEVGFKSESQDNRLRLNGAYFFSDYKDLQIVSQAETVAPIVLNAGKARIQGFELDLQVVPATNWLIEGSLGYLDAEYTDVDPGTGLTEDDSLVKAPEWSASTALSYTFTLTNGDSISPRVDYSYRDEYYNNAINSEPLKQDSYSLVNVGINYERANGDWRILAYGKNIGDEKYISAGYSEQNGPTSNLGISEVVRNRGSEWGISATYRFQ